MDNDHNSHKWRYSDSSYYDFVCKECGCAEFTEKSKLPCIPDFGSTVSEETMENIKAIDKNIQTAILNAHRFLVD